MISPRVVASASFHSLSVCVYAITHTGYYVFRGLMLCYGVFQEVVTKSSGFKCVFTLVY